ncbi:MAG: DUF2125 domain-containing protein [Bacteroidota bacterium]
MLIRRLVAVFAAALILAGLGYSAYWFHAAATLRKGLEHWADDRRAHGWQVGWDQIDTGGFPLHLRLALTAPHVADADGHTWHGEALTAHADPFDWTRLRLVAPGHHVLAWPGGNADVAAEAAQAEINLDRNGQLEDATLLATRLTVSGATAEPASAGGLAVTWDPLPVAHPDHTTATVRFSATAHDVLLPALDGLPLDRAVGLVEVTGRVLGALPQGSLPETLTRWSADGGTVELDHVSLEWAPMALEAQGTMALDPAGQPLVSLATRIRGFGPLMDRLSDTGTVPADTAGAAKMVLLLMAKPDAKGRPAVPVPVSLQDGSLYLGPARVARLPPLKWR